ncbi:MAG: mechanosensitive ion channel family protein [Bacteroidales bacterium]|nr:mechanosensitive ion channel family protein [Bacteroidales bacterium]MBN2757944.1 mechanosensitive ion channel family protein [Bacteroidales bacterium]
MTEFFSKTFYNNTIAQWAISLAIIIGSIIISKLIFFIISRIIKKITDKTKSKLDDIIIDMLEEPIVFAIIIAGVWYGLNFLNLSPWLDKFIGKVYYILITFNIAWFLSRFFDALVKEYLQPLVDKTESDLDDQLLPIASKGIKITIWTIAIVVGLNNAGYDVGALIAGLGIGGLALAMAAKDSVANLFGGFTVFADKPFTIRDRIKVKGFDGTVEEIGIRSTRLKTLEGRIVTIPNATFSNEAIENISSEPNRKIVSDIGLTYNTSPEKMLNAIEILKNIAIQNQNVSNDDIVAAFNSFGDSAMLIKFIYYINKGADIFNTSSEVNIEILKQFNDEKLEFAFPTQTVYTIKAN